MTAYDRLATRFARIATIDEASSVLGWDAATMMPPGGGAARGDQLAVLAGMSHSLLVAPAVGDDLAAAEATHGARSLVGRQPPADAPRPHPRDRDAARSGRGAGARQFRLREGLARGAAAVGFRAGAPASGGGGAAGARGGGGAGAGRGPRPVRRADGRLPARHARGRHRSGLRRLRGVPAPRRCRGRRSGRPAARHRCGRPGPFPVAVQEALCRRLAERLGLDFDHARLDRSAHPFSGGTPTDVRITTRYDEADFTQAVLARGARDRARAVRARPARRRMRASRSARRPAWRRMKASR